MGRKFSTDLTKRYGEGSEMLAFLVKRGRKMVQKVKTTAVAKYYGFERRTIFSTEGSFGFGGHPKVTPERDSKVTQK